MNLIDILAVIKKQDAGTHDLNMVIIIFVIIIIALISNIVIKKDKIK